MGRSSRRLWEDLWAIPRDNIESIAVHQTHVYKLLEEIGARPNMHMQKPRHVNTYHGCHSFTTKANTGF